MGKVTVICDRCGNTIEGLEIKGVGTTGFYHVTEGIWHKYADGEETVLCDDCMWKDPRYQRDYPPVTK